MDQLPYVISSNLLLFFSDGKSLTIVFHSTVKQRFEGQKTQTNNNDIMIDKQTPMNVIICFLITSHNLKIPTQCHFVLCFLHFMPSGIFFSFSKFTSHLVYLFLFPFSSPMWNKSMFVTSEHCLKCGIELQKSEYILI